MTLKPLPAYPQYEWAFSLTGHPLHISQAQPGEIYLCPLCHGRMVAKLGDIKQHHFAHESLKVCTPESVAQAVIGRWIAEQFEDCMRSRSSVSVTWTCPICQQPHTVDLLHGAARVQQEFAYRDTTFDIALLDSGGSAQAALLMHKPSRDLLLCAVRQSIALIVVDTANLHSPTLDLPTLLKGAAIYGGPCATQRAAADQGVITDHARLRDLLTQAVAAPPHRVYGTLENLGALTHVFSLESQRLWLPPLLWERAVGGMHHAISPTLQVTSQEWEQPDGAIIALYYITVGQTAAIAVRRYPPGQRPYARLDTAAFRGGRMTAAAVARSFAEL
jgi:hypothetical protein